MIIECIIAAIFVIAYVLWRQAMALAARDNLIEFIVSLHDSDHSPSAKSLAQETAKDSLDRFLMIKMSFSIFRGWGQRKRIEKALRNTWDTKDWEMLQQVFAKMFIVNFKIAPITFITSIFILLSLSLLRYLGAWILLIGTFTAGQAVAVPNSPMKNMRNNIYCQAEEITSESLSH